MTEQEWLACTDPDQMFDFLRGEVPPTNQGLLEWLGLRRAPPIAPASFRASNRKRRLLACACCRRIWELFRDERSRQAVLVSERFADGLADEQELATARQGAQSAVGELASRERDVWDSMRAEAFCLPAASWKALAWAARAAVDVVSRGTPEAAVPSIVSAGLATGAREGITAWVTERTGAKALEQLMRDIFHLLPFRPTAIKADLLAWNDATIPKLAEAIYVERAFDRLPILADALEEAGCDNLEVLGHCRQEGIVHVRGCWVIDLLLGKE